MLQGLCSLAVPDWQWQITGLQKMNHEWHVCRAVHHVSFRADKAWPDCAYEWHALGDRALAARNVCTKAQMLVEMQDIASVLRC